MGAGWATREACALRSALGAGAAGRGPHRPAPRGAGGARGRARRLARRGRVPGAGGDRRAGRYTLRVTRIGYRERTLAVALEGGRTLQLDVELVPDPVLLEGVGVSVAREAGAGTAVSREAIASSGARSAGDVLRDLPGVVVRSTGPGSAQTASVRGSAPDAVLVLVDGVVLNDPVTGEADLSTVPAETIGSLVLLPGARSARYGPRAEAGGILIETRREDARRPDPPAPRVRGRPDARGLAERLGAAGRRAPPRPRRGGVGEARAPGEGLRAHAPRSPGGRSSPGLAGLAAAS